MTSRALDVPLSVLADDSPLTAIRGFIYKTYVIAELEVRKLKHDPTELVTRAVQPALWLLIFGEVFTRLRAIPTGGVPYLDFMAPGILAQSVLFVAIFYGIASPPRKNPLSPRYFSPAACSIRPVAGQ